MPTDDNRYDLGDIVTVSPNLTTVWKTSDGTADGAPGTWNFTPWDKENGFVITEDTTITGAWKFTPDIYKVTYVVNDDAVYGKPADSIVPTDETEYGYKSSVTVADNLTTTQNYAQVNGKRVPGTWTFVVWDKESGFLITSDTIISGAWSFAPSGDNKDDSKDDSVDPTNPPEPIKPPRTGDNSNIGLWLSLMLISLAAFFGTCIYRPKHRYGENHE